MRVHVAKAAPQILGVAKPDGSVIDRMHPVSPGSIVTLYIAGIGDGAILPSLKFTVFYDDPPVVLFVGPAPGARVQASFKSTCSYPQRCSTARTSWLSAWMTRP